MECCVLGGFTDSAGTARMVLDDSSTLRSAGSIGGSLDAHWRGYEGSGRLPASQRGVKRKPDRSTRTVGWKPMPNTVYELTWQAEGYRAGVIG
jgi:hypothetical protein